MEENFCSYVPSFISDFLAALIRYFSEKRKLLRNFLCVDIPPKWQGYENLTPRSAQ